MVNGALATRCQALIAAGDAATAGAKGRLAGLHLTQGDATAAARLVGAARSDLIGVYDIAFRDIVSGLALITALCGVVTYGALGRGRPRGADGAPSAPRAS